MFTRWGFSKTIPSIPEKEMICGFDLGTQWYPKIPLFHCSKIAQSPGHGLWCGALLGRCEKALGEEWSAWKNGKQALKDQIKPWYKIMAH
jgi:hypothetical protein